MRAEVDRILLDRGRRAGRGQEAASFAAAVVLHILLLGIALFLPRLQPPPKPLEFVPVTVIPAQALGVRRPAPPRQSAPKPSEAETPAPAKAEATPAPKPEEPEPVKPKADEAPVLPEKTDTKKKPELPTKPETKKPADTGKPSTAAGGKNTGPATGGRPNGNPNSPPNATAVGETGDQAGRRGAPTGSPLGTTAFGSRMGVDNPDFTYGYYLDRLLSLIDAQWARPSMGTGIKTVIIFRINRVGSMTDLRVEQSSGYTSFDLAALRAVQNAAPFPPLPWAYKHQDLGVNLIVR
jgi:TonB family protein